MKISEDQQRLFPIFFGSHDEKGVHVAVQSVLDLCFDDFETSNSIQKGILDITLNKDSVISIKYPKTGHTLYNSDSPDRQHKSVLLTVDPVFNIPDEGKDRNKDFRFYALDIVKQVSEIFSCHINEIGLELKFKIYQDSFDYKEIRQDMLDSYLRLESTTRGITIKFNNELKGIQKVIKADTLESYFRENLTIKRGSKYHSDILQLDDEFSFPLTSKANLRLGREVDQDNFVTVHTLLSISDKPLNYTEFIHNKLNFHSKIYWGVHREAFEDAIVAFFTIYSNVSDCKIIQNICIPYINTLVISYSEVTRYSDSAKMGINYEELYIELKRMYTLLLLSFRNNSDKNLLALIDKLNQSSNN